MRSEATGSSSGDRGTGCHLEPLKWRCYLLEMPTVSNLCHAMESIAPLQYAAEWDNVGLLVGRRDASISKVLLCIDLTSAVLQEATESGVQAIVAYHPTIFTPRTRMSDEDRGGDLLLSLIEAGIAVYSPHTALDAAAGGMTDWLIEAVGEGAVSPIESASELGPSETLMIVTYTPRDRVDEVRAAMASAGAGRIGEYTHCSTAIDSSGTFRGEDGTNPVVGQAGELESVEETRLMMVCGQAALAVAVAALRAAHPYEEPPVHVVPLAGRPMHDTGSGRVTRLDSPLRLEQIIDRYKARLGVTTMRVVEGIGGPQKHTTIGCCPGAGGAMLAAAERVGATVFVTGEMRHHDVLAARERGTSVLLAGHTNTERGYLPLLRSRLEGALPNCEIGVSAADITPWVDA